MFGYRSEQKLCLGTKGFAAPEQYQGRLTAASDVYGFGKTMWALMGEGKWRQFLSSPSWCYLLFQCCRKDEKRRIPDMETLERKLKALSEKGLRVSGKQLFLVAGLFTLLLFTVSGIFLAGKETKKKQTLPLSQALTQVTQNYYDTSFWEKDQKEQKEVCEKTERELQKLLKAYPKKEEQNRILMLLALNAELAEEDAHARQYYQQLLLFDPDCTEGYGEYGRYLWRKGEKEKSLECFFHYESAESQGERQQEKTPGLLKWEGEMKEYQKERAQ
ncbi:serine/threonine protein kinase [gut metagenome]|uniref:Serine/threonine protein kinase n=1 Tax=gut metagenome TaxID=749906 RepID=J9G3J9_9ZZZZ